MKLVRNVSFVVMAKSIEALVTNNPYLKKDSHILVGVSGGADSVVLAHILHKKGVTISIAHCHFNLRGKDADADQQFTKELALSLQVPFYTTKFETEVYARTRKVSIQMAARDLRYFWFEKLCKENGLDQIAVGTHLTDRVETFLFNATKGAGLSGLRGIKPLNGKIVRPLLDSNKEEIYTYAKEEGLQWREDDSNQSIKYARNKIRHKVLPVLQEINPNLEATFQRNFETLSRVDAFMEAQVDSIWKEWIVKEEKSIKVSISKIKEAPFADVVLRYQLKPFGFNGSQVHDLLRAIEGQPGGMISSLDYHLYIDRAFVFIQQKRFFSAGNDFRITEFMGEITQPLHLVFEDKHAEEVQIEPHVNKAYFDFDKLKFPLNLRKWKAGDKFTPFGMKGQKKVSDVLIDQKIPKHVKENIWVLESDNEICWVVGVRSSEKFKMESGTSRAYFIELKA